MAAKNLPITEAQLIGLFIEAILFGIHLITLGFCLHTLFTSGGRWRRRDEVHWGMLTVSLALFGVAAFDIALGFYHDLKAFVFYTGEGGAIAEFTDISDWINITKTVTVVVQVMIGDGMLIYRCWIVYGRSWKAIAFSAFFWVACLGAGIWITFLESTLRSKILVNASQLMSSGTTFWAFTVVLNVVTTGLIVWRLWRVDSGVRVFRGAGIIVPNEKSHLEKLIQIIIESGLLYTITAFISCVTFVTGSVGIYAITDAETQIVGISFNLIITRAANIRKNSEDYTCSCRVLNGTLPLQFITPPSQITPPGSYQKTDVHLTLQEPKRGRENISEG